MAPELMASRLTDGEVLPGLRLVTLPMGVQDVVTLNGSFYGGDAFSPAGQRATAEVTAAMLDKGTERRDKFEIGAALESVGASIHFASDDYRVNFSARCLKDDVPLVVELLAEQLRLPAFHAKDVASLQKRAEANLQRQGESTDEQARIAFSQHLFPENHPNYVPSIEEQMADVRAVTPNHLKAFHQAHYGLGSMQVVVTGDIDRAVLEKQLSVHFGDWPLVELTPAPLDGMRASTNGSGGTYFVSMAEKTSVDLMLGMAVGIDREHEDYRPLMMASFILGGNFSARLMATVRDQAGLTYGIGSSLGGAADGKDGYWTIYATFAPHLLGEGRAATMVQLEKWLKSGATAEELAAKITTITGSYQVGLASTKGVAGALLDIMERGRPLSYLDEYPEEIRALTLEQVNGVIGRYLSLDRLTIVAAGSIDADGNPLADA
ncbi:MAG: insulinase family protein [Candidatus Marinimicrobia bacterium]|nr:insulinase family protein [Candidatus Neomarinimicrobiota bacterium]